MQFPREPCGIGRTPERPRPVAERYGVSLINRRAYGENVPGDSRFAAEASVAVLFPHEGMPLGSSACRCMLDVRIRRRLAAVARSQSRRYFNGDRTARRVARGRTSPGLEDTGPGRRLLFVCRGGRPPV